MTTAKKELETAMGDNMPGALPSSAPGLALRAKLAQFAVEHGLKSEGQAMIVVAARYFRMVESEKWAGWIAESKGKS